MANPPPWVAHTSRSEGYGQFSQQRGNTVAGVAAGVVTSADVNSQPRIGTQMTPSKWSYIWFGLATLYLLGVYTGHVVVSRER
jgi:hypothetical protein